MGKLPTLHLYLKNVVKPIRIIIARFHWDHWCVNWLGRLLSLVRWSFGETSISYFRTGLVRWRADKHFLSFFPAMTIGLNDSTAKKPTDIAFLDFSTPFDSVPHERLLLSKSVNWHSDGCLLQWFLIFLTGHMQRFVLRGTCSFWSPILSGVPQRTILGQLE